MYERPYLSLNRFMREHFGQRVQKIPVDAGLGCPHRKNDGTGGCLFCDSRGSGTGAWERGVDIGRQMEAGIRWGKRRYKAHLYMAYFQSWSNTFATPEKLRSIYSEAMMDDSVVALAIGTRPDCIDMERLDIIAQVARKRMVWMEYGMQSASDRSLQLLNRGHTVNDFIKAVEMTKRYGFHVCAHVIFGIPGEGHEEMRQSVELLKIVGVDGVKFHQLFAVKGTMLHTMYEQGRFVPISFEEYADMTAWAIDRLGRDMVIHRLAGDPPLNELVAPQWSLDKRRVVQAIHDRLRNA